MEEGISDTEDRNPEVIQKEEKRYLSIKRTLWEISDSISKSNIRIIATQEGERKKVIESLLNQIVDENF